MYSQRCSTSSKGVRSGCTWRISTAIIIAIEKNRAQPPREAILSFHWRCTLSCLSPYCANKPRPLYVSTCSEQNWNPWQQISRGRGRMHYLQESIDGSGHVKHPREQRPNSGGDRTSHGGRERKKKSEGGQRGWKSEGERERGVSRDER